MCRIMTSNYTNCTSENGISISEDRGKKVNFKGNCLQVFAPKKEFFDKTKGENVRCYVEEYYKQVLSKLDPVTVLDIIPEGAILLCYEDDIEFYHRHLVAFWFELFLGMTTAEVVENPVRETLKKAPRPEYLKDILEDVIKENYNMNGFDNIKDAYSYNKCTQEAYTKKLILT